MVLLLGNICNEQIHKIYHLNFELPFYFLPHAADSIRSKTAWYS